ncbi:Transcription factor bHLH113 [Striga hermonthica]|uniref:Transcription factor bHLH113 n=1 Tax=Striga hermonthica TaxID=68872 RepID=A0A9N7N7G7_STRHE|nr:Transcription factor bHLH113 [Striga hermonthica]
MAGNSGGFEPDDPLVPGGSYSELLFGDDISGLQTNGFFGFTKTDDDEKNISNSNPKMLCFGDYAKQSSPVKMAAAEGSKKTGRKVGPACNVAKKEKLGDRITALQQLVSPFGKTDTASVLHEASGYIRFLHDQVQVLCSPYLQRLPTTIEEPPHPENGDLKEWETKKKSYLRSRGLCLVPVELTLHVAEESINGADLWSSAAVVDSVLTG